MEKNVEAMVEILEQELEGAFEVKDRKSLHRYVVLLTENVVKKENYEKKQAEIRSDIRALTEVIKQGFERMDERFGEVNVHLTDISTKMFHFMVWSFGFSVTQAGVIIGVLKSL